MKQSLQILHIEDSEADFELVGHLLAKDGLNCQMKRVETRSQVFDELQNNSYDLILTDCKLPNFSGLHALEIARALRPEVPFVFVSGTIGEETAIESLRNGATDYVLKDHLSRLVPAVRRALAESEEKMLCRQLQNRMREAGRLEAISTLSHGIAHDFNNILTIILGYASLLTVESNRPNRVLEIADTITQAGRRGSDVVQQLLAFAHKSDSHMASTDLNRAVQENLGLLQKKLPAKIELRFTPTPNLPRVLIDTSQLERILLNLVSNSIEAMPDGGVITLATKLVSAAKVPGMLPELNEGNYVCLEVTDTGLGMDPATRDHVFEPFYTTKERGRGTGLGLPVVYGLMQAQSGVIDLASRPGEGTTVFLYFPEPALRAMPTPPVPRESDPALTGSETILVIEDEPDVCFYLETILQSHGYHALTAHDYDEALQKFQPHQDEVALVFSDVGLPRVDGITLCAKLRQLKPDLPVILASGYSPKEFQSRMNDLGDVDFLAKPYQTEGILRLVRKTLDAAKVT